MYLELLKKFAKPLLALLAVLVLFVSGYWYGKKSNPAEIKTVTVEKVVEKIVEKEVSKQKQDTDKVTKTITNKDGTTETTVTEHTHTDTDISKSSETDKSTSIVAKTDTKFDTASKYRLGLNARLNVTDTISDHRFDPAYGATAGMRVVGPIWLDTEYNFSKRDISLGISLEF